MNQKPLVSVIVPTKNSAEFLDRCLSSIVNQSYKNIELIVVDNNSKDETQNIAKHYTKHVYTKGPERSAQVNYGVEKAIGIYVYKVDSDFVLEQTVIEECVEEIQKGFDAVVVHNSPDVSVSWIAKIRKFEVDMYKYDLTHSSARFVSKNVYQSIGGFNSSITAGEDYDFQNKLNRGNYSTGYVSAEALHLGEPKKILPHLMKYYSYGKDFVNYQANNQKESKKQLGFFRSVYLRHYKSFLIHPVMATKFVIYTLFKYGAGALGLISAKINSR